MRMFTKPIFKPASGGGGGGSLVLPTTDLVFQYDFSALGLSDGTAISSVSDLVGSNHLSQSTSGAQPVFKTGIMANGRGVARFDGTDDFLYAGSNATYRHAFIVFKMTDAGNVFATYDGVLTHTLNSGEFTWVGNIGGNSFYDTTPSSTYVKSGSSTLVGPFSAFELCEASRATSYSLTPQIGRDRDFSGRCMKGDVAGVFAYSTIQSGTPLTDIRSAILAYYGV